MADIAKYRQEIEKFNSSYAKAAIKEPANFWGLAGFLVAAAYADSVIPLFIALVFEAIYLVFVPLLPAYRQMVNRREKERLLAAHIAGREKLIKSFTPRERRENKTHSANECPDTKAPRRLIRRDRAQRKTCRRAAPVDREHFRISKRRARHDLHSREILTSRLRAVIRFHRDDKTDARRHRRRGRSP